MSDQHAFELTPEARQHFEKTPGPWEYRYWEGSKSMFPYAEIGVNLDAPRPHCQYVARAGKEEDARLIAAAPELLEALRTCEAALTWLNYGPGSLAVWDLIQNARNTIAKAGSEPLPALAQRPLTIGTTLPVTFAPTALEQTMRAKHEAGECGWGCPECKSE